MVGILALGGAGHCSLCLVSAGRHYYCAIIIDLHILPAYCYCVPACVCSDWGGDLLSSSGTELCSELASQEDSSFGLFFFFSLPIVWNCVESCGTCAALEWNCVESAQKTQQDGELDDRTPDRRQLVISSQKDVSTCCN